MRAGRFFRYVWRINGVLVLAALSVALIAVVASYLSDLTRRNVRQGADAQAVTDDRSEAPLRLEPPRTVAGTRILRAELVRSVSTSKFGSSGETSETHNILFIEPVSGTSRWLLKTHDEIVSHTEDIRPATDAREERTPLASIALVKRSADEAAPGELLVFDPTGAEIVSVGDGIRRIQAAFASGSEFLVVFERDAKYHVARFDAASRRKLGEAQIRVPALR